MCVPEYKKVLIGVAFSPNLKANVFEALRMSAMFQSSLVIVHVGLKSTKKEASLNNIIKEFPGLMPEYTVVWRPGAPKRVLLDACSEQGADLLVLGALQREGILKYYIGSVARKVTRKAPCDVLLLIKPSINRVPCVFGVVNGFNHDKTDVTIYRAFNVLRSLGANKLTIVEEIPENTVDIRVDDDKGLRESTIVKERITLREKSRMDKLLDSLPSSLTSEINHNIQPVFGRRGYSIGHFARVKRADLLIMNAPGVNSLWDRLFPHDIEYILSDLPTDVLIVR
jgi:nucleotide-binding universal stress UspA family protein